MAQRTTLVSNRIRNGEEVVASARTHRDEMARRLADRVEGWTAEQALAVIDALADHLHQHDAALGDAEDAYVAEQADDPALRDARDHAAATLGDLSMRARSRIEDTLGSVGLQRYGLEGPTPRSPDALVTHVDGAVKLLRADVAEMEDGLGGTFATTALAESLAAALAPLADVVSQLRTENREREGALTARDRALTEWTEAYQGVASTLSGLYRLAGRRDLADRIRPNERRATGREITEPGAPDPAPDSPVVDVPAPTDEPGPPSPV